jgi:hypothetical protein
MSLLHCHLCAALWSIAEVCADLPAVQSAFCDVGAIDSLTLSMRRYRHDIHVQTQGLSALVALVVGHATNPSAASVAGGHSVAVDAMTQHATDFHLQSLALTALTHIAQDHPLNQTLVAQAGGVDAIVSTMGRFALVFDLQQRGCAALATIIRAHDANRVAVEWAGGIEATVRAMRLFADAAMLQAAACVLLEDLVLTSSARGRFMAAGGVTVMQEARRRHARVPSVARAANSLLSRVPSRA